MLSQNVILPKKTCPQTNIVSLHRVPGCRSCDKLNVNINIFTFISSNVMWTHWTQGKINAKSCPGYMQQLNSSITLICLCLGKQAGVHTTAQPHGYAEFCLPAGTACTLRERAQHQAWCDWGPCLYHMCFLSLFKKNRRDQILMRGSPWCQIKIILIICIYLYILGFCNFFWNKHIWRKLL